MDPFYRDISWLCQVGIGKLVHLEWLGHCPHEAFLLNQVCFPVWIFVDGFIIRYIYRLQKRTIQSMNHSSYLLIERDPFHMQVKQEKRHKNGSFNCDCCFFHPEPDEEEKNEGEIGLLALPSTVLTNNWTYFYSTFYSFFFSFTVIVLTIETFDELVTHRKADEVWLVDFFAPWCGPCNQLAPHWRRLARSLITLTNIYVASVDCVAQQLLCSRQSVNAYPTIRFYGAGSASKYMWVDILKLGIP